MIIDKKQVLMFYGWSDDPKIDECAHKAYIDLCRTLKFSKSDSDLKRESKQNKDEYISQKKKFRDDVDNYIIGQIETLLEAPHADFEEWHEKTCDEIIEKAKESKLFKESEKNESMFYYGQAQKWLNMTLKNMMIAGVESDRFVNIEQHLHIPMDAFILQIASQWGVKSPKNLPWSKWDKTAYLAIQRKLQDSIKAKYPLETPLEWEFMAWINERDK